MATKRRPFRPPGQAPASQQDAPAAEDRPPVRPADQTTPVPPVESPDGAAEDADAVARDIIAGIELLQGIRVLRRIADGGMGTVFLAEQLGTAGFSKTVAVKVIKRDWLRDKRALGLFIGEAKLVADLVHDNICQVYSLARHKGQLFVVMEFLHGLGLDRFLDAHYQSGYLPPFEYSAFIASRVCRGLAYAHSKKGRDGRPLSVVHRDVTPSNVMLDFRGSVKLTDFGIALAVTNQILAGPGVVTGKLDYMSPEQALAIEVDARSDIYSLGLCLYELLVGQSVFNVYDINELREQQKKPIRSPRELNPQVPEELSLITMKALAYSPESRFQTAKDFGNSLEYYMYRDKWGPTNEKLAEYLQKVFPNIDRDRIL
jgi:serine/threonine-protein kinase